MSLKIIIVYATAGSGHRRAAQAIHHCLKKNWPESNITFIDILEYTNPLFANFYSHGYSLLVTHLRFIWVISYHITKLKYISWFFNFISYLNCQRFRNLLIQEQADIVLATHFFPAGIVAHLKTKGKVNSRLVTVITDLGLHPFWVFKNCDDYIVSLDYTRSCLIRRGIDEDRVKVLGMPISSGFSIRHQQDRPGKNFTALLVTGSFGFSFIEKIVDMLYSEMDLLVVCGNNQRLYNRLNCKHYAGVRLFGFTENMPELMSQADIIITKPGGLTIAEALVMRLPLIFISSIPGQETENARTLQGYGCGINANSPESLKDIAINLKTNPERLALMRSNIEKFRKPNAAEELCRYVCSGSI